MFTEEEKQRMRQGEVVECVGHRYVQCQVCRRPVRVSGWFRRLHLCLLPEDRERVLRGEVTVLESW